MAFICSPDDSRGPRRSAKSSVSAPSNGRSVDQPPRQITRPAELLRTADRVCRDCSLSDTGLEAKLQEDGFSWAPFSLYHRTPVGSRPNGSWIYRSSVLADRQLHIILFAQTPDTIDIYAHIEYNWLRHPIKHAQQINVDREKGARQVRQWLNEHDLDSKHKSRLSRRLTHLLERFRERFSRRDSRDLN